MKKFEIIVALLERVACIYKEILMIMLVMALCLTLFIDKLSIALGW
jgi:hypothetical protein